MTWAEEIVDRLAVLKRNGWTFDQAWKAALREFPPTGREFRGMNRELTLLSGRESDPVEWMRWACSDAWHGRRPALVHLAHGLPDPDDAGHGWGSPQARKRQGAAA